MTLGFALGQSALYFCCSTPGQDITNMLVHKCMYTAYRIPLLIFLYCPCIWQKPFPEFEKIDKVSSPETSFYDEEDDVPLQPIALGDKREIPTRFPVASQQAGPSLLSQRSTQQSIEATTSNSIGGGNVPANSGSSRTKVASRIEESNSQSSSTAENQRRIESFLEDLMKAQADKTEKPEISKQGKSGPSSCDDVSLSSSSQQPCPARPDSTTTRKSTATESVDVSVDGKRSTETSPAEVKLSWCNCSVLVYARTY